MVITLGQQYNVEEKPTVILYTCISRHAGTPDKKQKQSRNNVVYLILFMVVIIYYHIGYKDKATTWYSIYYLNGYSTERGVAKK